MRGFADAYRGALQRCGPGDHEVRARLEELLRGVEQELQLHASYAKVKH